MLFYDQYTDPDKDFFKKILNHVVIEPDMEIDKQPDKSFAIIIVGNRRHRMFPIHTPKDTVLSALYFLKNKEIIPEECAKIIGSKLKEACLKFNLEKLRDLFEDYADTVGSHEIQMSDLSKTAAANTQNDNVFYGIEINGVKKFPMPDKMHTLKAIAAYPKVADKLTPQQRKILSRNIALKALEFDINLDKLLIKEINPHIVQDIKYRIKDLPLEAQKMYLAVANAIQKGELNYREGATAIRMLDKMYGIDNYKRRITPETAVSGIASPEITNSQSIKEFKSLLNQEKVASIDEVVTLIKADTEKQIRSKLEEQFDKELVSDLYKDPETIFNSLPKPHQELIEKIIKGEVVPQTISEED